MRGFEWRAVVAGVSVLMSPGLALASGFTPSGKLPVPLPKPAFVDLDSAYIEPKPLPKPAVKEAVKETVAVVVPASLTVVAPALAPRPAPPVSDGDETKDSSSWQRIPVSPVSLSIPSDAEKRMNAEPLPAQSVDFIKVFKRQRLMILMSHDQVVRTYRIRLGDHPVGAKVEQGDGRTPEGLYLIDKHNPNSPFHLSLHISYPNDDDIARARAKGVSPGGSIVIHGLPFDTAWSRAVQKSMDWTSGCIALTDADVEDVYRLVPDGTPIRINP